MKKINQLKQVVLTLTLLFMLSSDILSKDVKSASKTRSESKELIKNGSFEEAEEHRNARDLLRKKKFDIETGEEDWTKGWYVNAGVGSGKVRIITGEDAPDGRRYLHFQSKWGLHVVSRMPLNDASKTYAYSFKAKGLGNLSIHAYVYGVKKGKKGDRQYIGYPTLQKIPLTSEWKEYSGTLKVKNPDARYFRLFFSCRGNVSIDQISLKLAPKIEQAKK